jgi:hypothetical protein
MERILKLAVATHYMLSNNYQTPTIKQLKRDFGHDIRTLYGECQKLMNQYRRNPPTLTEGTESDDSLIDFFTEYGVGSRYFNLNEVCISNAVYEECTAFQVRERAALNLMYKMDREGRSNHFTMDLNEDGHPMTVFDCLHRQYVIRKSAPLIIWRIVESLRPIHFLLEGMAARASDYEVANNIPSMVIPHYEDFFYFLLADKADIKKRKRWLEIFNG